MNLKDLYIDFFKSKGHVQIPSAPVIPENDSSVLFNTAGMQPLIPYLLGENHPLGKRLVDYQKCVRLTDLEEVGDTTHHTFFEMLGNWSLGDYFKEESIEYSFEFLTKVLEIPVERLAISVFKGNETSPKDEEAYKKWLSLGIPMSRIAFLDERHNWWAAGETGPCGSDTEIFYWRSKEDVPTNFDSEDDNWVEIWNNVFMQYNRLDDGSLKPLERKNIDTGMGLERTVSVLEGVDDNYLASIWSNALTELKNISGLPYEEEEIKKSMRIILDHIRTSVIILGDNAHIRPSNTDQGYILRRLIRRAIRHAKKLNIDINSNWMERLAKIFIKQYGSYYEELKTNENYILENLEAEKIKFNRTLEKGLREFDKIKRNLDGNKINKDLAFKLYDTYGFPIELTVEVAHDNNLEVDTEGFKEKFKAHQELSRAGAKEKFKGGLSSSNEINTRYHTATHLLNAALKVIISPDIHQRGSNITDERMRFDFNFDRKLTKEELQNVEDLVNKWIKESIPVTVEEMPKEEALKTGAEAMFVERYPSIVKVYSIGDVSKEICTGPHVKNTSEIKSFKITKEEASSAGVRRIKAVIE